jgi:outer membrane biosynthesis protein TonB
VAATVVITLAAGCSGERESLPEPVAMPTQPVPEVTPIPLPDTVCIEQMGLRTNSGEPRKIVHVRPQFPERTTPTRFGSSMWYGVAEILPDGSVGNVRVVKPFDVQPPWPEFEEAAPAAIRSWRYEPVCVDGHPVKVEVGITVEIFLR